MLLTDTEKTSDETEHRDDFLVIFKNWMIYSSSPLSLGDTFQDPQWMPETMGNTDPCKYILFYLYIHTVHLKEALIASPWHIQIAGITIVTFWGYY